MENPGGKVGVFVGKDILPSHLANHLFLFIYLPTGLELVKEDYNTSNQLFAHNAVVVIVFVGY